MKARTLFYILLFVCAECGWNLTAQTKLNGTVVDKNNQSVFD